MTASTRRWSSSVSGSCSFARMLLTCFSTVPSVTQSRRAIPDVRAPLGHQREHLALARRELLERVVPAPGSDELLDQAGSTTEPPSAIRSSALEEVVTSVTRLLSR